MITVPFKTSRAPRPAPLRREPIRFDRVVTPTFIRDVDELRAFTMDIRQVLSDNAIRDMLAEDDARFISSINSVMPGPDEPVSPTPPEGATIFRSSFFRG